MDFNFHLPLFIVLRNYLPTCASSLKELVFIHSKNVHLSLFSMFKLYYGNSKHKIKVKFDNYLQSERPH